MAELAHCENVVVKLGGIGMPRLGGGFEHGVLPASSVELADAWGEPIRYVIEHFGVDRCMFESNFPVDRQSTNYVCLWNSFKRMTSDMSESEKDLLFRGTASRVYRL